MNQKAGITGRGSAEAAKIRSKTVAEAEERCVWRGVDSGVDPRKNR